MRQFLINVAVIFSITASAQTIPVDKDVRIGKLDNGLTYYIRHNEEPKGQANFYIAQKVGSILEEEDQRGLAHFLEHMCFNGTEHFPGNGVIKYCERIGVKFGDNLNAYTSIDETVYNIDNVPMNNKENIDSCLWILHDWANALLLTDEDIDHERGVIHEEWRTRANAQIRLTEKILPKIYPVGTNHARPDGSNRYGHRMPIGLMEIVDNFPYKALRDYYSRWYRPDLQAIIVVGDINCYDIEAKIRDIFGRISKPLNPIERYYVEVPDNEQPIVCIASDKEQSHTTTYIFFKHDPYPMDQRTQLDYYKWLYVKDAVSRMINARLQEKLESTTPPFVEAGVDENVFFVAKTKDAFQGVVASSEAGLMQATTTLYREMLRVIRYGFTEIEFERVKAEMTADIEAAYNSRDKKKSAEYCHEYVNHFLNMEPIPDIKYELDMYRQIAETMTAESVSKIFSEQITGGSHSATPFAPTKNLVVCAMVPQKEGVSYPTESELNANLEAVAAEKIEPYVDVVNSEPLISSMPKPGKVVKSKDIEMGYKRYKLSNGVTVYFRQTDFNANEILMSAFSEGGTSLYPASMLPDLKTINEVLNASGLGDFSRSELTKALAGRKLSVVPYVGLYDERIESSTTPKDLETMLQLNHLYFTSMRMDLDAYSSWRERSRAAIANRESEPSAALHDSLIGIIYDNGERAQPLHSSDLDAINYEHIMQIARERFSNAADFTFIITGAVDEATLLPLIEQYIASLPTNNHFESPNTDVIGYRSGQHQHMFNRKMEIPMVSSMFFDHADIKYSLKNKLSLDLALSSLSETLLEEIREKESGTYGIASYGDIISTPKSQQKSYIQIFYQTDPEKFIYLNQRVRDIVEKFAAEGPSAESLAKGKEYMLKNNREHRRDNSYWQNAISEKLKTGVDLTRDFETILIGITTKDIRQLITTILRQKNHTEVIMVGE